MSPTEAILTVVTSPQMIIRALERNLGVIERQIDGLTHEDSLLQLPFRGNCLNWTIGHLVASRNSLLKLVGEEPIWDEAKRLRYDRDSEPVVDGSDALHFDSILADLRASQERLLDALNKQTVESMSEPVEMLGQPAPRGAWLHFLAWHETYHVGQTEIFRQLAGKNDKVI